MIGVDFDRADGLQQVSQSLGQGVGHSFELVDRRSDELGTRDCEMLEGQSQSIKG